MTVMWAAVDVQHGRVWGIGFTRERAAFDAADQLARVDPGTTTDVPPEGELQFFVVGVEECRAIANGDVRWSRALRGGSTSPQEGRSALSPQYRAFPVTGTRPGSTLYPVEPVTLVEAVGFCRRAGVACELWESAAGDAVGDGPVGIVLANGDWRVTG